MTAQNRKKTIQTDICVIGAGLSGICAAIAAARRGANVVLVHDRPVLGGNASSEIRMCIRGASSKFPEYREGGILEEIANRNIFYNPQMSYTLWDSVLYGIVKEESRINLMLNCACLGADSTDNLIKEIYCRGLNNYTDYTISAKTFIDCSGDCILADYTKAEYMLGREASNEYDESLAPKVPDKKTMGNTCVMQAREMNHEVKYLPPPFAKKFTDEDLVYRLDLNDPKFWEATNFWWLEAGGAEDSLADAEEIKDRLLSAAYGAWDYIKNSGYFDSKNWDLDFVSFIGAKRESRRYVGDYILTQKDIDEVKVFKDEVAYGGWTMDDHNPLGMETKEPPNAQHEIKSPYGIPYRCLYSKNIDNLMFAGRNISVTHMALSSTRVMATCALLGQAVGTAAALCTEKQVYPRELSHDIKQLQEALLEDDCYLLNTTLKTGSERKIGNNDFAIELDINTDYKKEFESKFCKQIRIVFDDNISRDYISHRKYERLFPSKFHIVLNADKAVMPPRLSKSFEVFIKKDEKWQKTFSCKDNYKRLVYIPCNEDIEGVCINVSETYGDKPRLYSIEAL